MTSSPNFVQIVGVVSREPLVFGEENKRTSLSIGGSEKLNGRDNVFFQEVRAGGDEGKFAAKIEPGTPVVVTGMLRHETWEKDGEKKSITYVRAHAIRRLPNPESYAMEQRIAPATGKPYHVMKGGYVSIAISGNLARAELRYTPDGTPVLGGSFGSKEEWLKDGKVEERTNWIGFNVWGPEAEKLAEQGIGKGWSISVIDGTIRNRSSKSQTNGKTYNNTDIEAGRGRMEFLPKRGSGASTKEFDISMLDDTNPPEETELPF